MVVNKVKVLEEYRTERYITFGKENAEDLEACSDMKKNI
jgi:hypothetical protein